MVPPDPAPSPLPIGPSVEAWRAMSDAAREAFLVSVLEALTVPAEAMTEGRPHKEAKTRAVDRLGLHFRTLGRGLYLAEEMAVVYPNEPVFSPDVLAVVDVPQPERDERLAWVVADEGRGIDFVLEVLHQGDRKKDLVTNVQRYARLSIPEYFVYDRARQQILGHRLVDGGRYERIVPQAGRTHSAVLGIDFAVQDGLLGLFHGSAELYGTNDLVGKLNGMVSSLERKAIDAEARLEAAEAEAGQARALADEERKRADEERKRADLAAQRSTTGTAQLRAGIVAALTARGLTVSQAQRERLDACDDPAMLGAWLVAALGAKSTEEAMSAGLRPNGRWAQGQTPATGSPPQRSGSFPVGSTAVLAAHP